MMPSSPITIGNTPTRSAFKAVGNENGAALILAIIMLVVLSLLGSVALMSSDSELKVSGNYQVAKQTFWVADRAVEYATSRNILMNMGSSLDLMTVDALGDHKAFIDAGGGGFLRQGVVTDLGPGDLPAKLAGAYSSDFGANYYHVTATARQRDDDTSPAVQVDTTIIRIYKSEDESIFITTGGG